MTRAPGNRIRSVVGALAFVLLPLVLHVAIGSSVWLSPASLLRALVAGPNGADESLAAIVWTLRLPRALTCVLTGAILGSCGAVFQVVFRNPLAEPYVVGVSSGAAAGGAIATVVGFSTALGGLGLMVSAVLGGLFTFALVLAIARAGKLRSLTGLLLAGVVVGALIGGLLTVVLIVAGQDSNRVLMWLFGSTSSARWGSVAWLVVASAAMLAVFLFYARALNALALGSEAAASLGVNVERARGHLLFAGCAAASCAVGATGIIGFLGLVAPHIARQAAGPDARLAVPLSGLIGGALLLLADILAQRVAGVIELPVGAVTAVLGAPMLLVLLRRFATN